MASLSLGVLLLLLSHLPCCISWTAAANLPVFWDLEAANVTSYEEQVLVYSLQGLVNQGHGGQPSLFYNTGAKVTPTAAPAASPEGCLRLL